MAQSFREGYDLTKLTTLSTYAIAETQTATAFVPPFARLPYEVWIAPKAFRPNPAALSDAEVSDFANLLATTSRKYDTFFNRTCPYVMIVYAAPRGMEQYFPFHIQFYPLLRAPGKLKYLAGVEQGAGSFLVDMLPETAAENLRNVKLENAS